MKSVYFIGIGGIGMSAIARYYNHEGYSVLGYDRTPSALTDALISEGIDIHFTDSPEMIPSDRQNTLVIYTPAIPEDLNELKYVISNNYRLVKRSKALGEIASSNKTLAVAGTHGKTTTSTLLAHILTYSSEGCSAFLGGISRNYNSNLLLSNNPVLVAEADEFDRSFLQLFPDIALITSCDADHLDIYNDAQTIRKAFEEFASQVKEYLILKNDIDISLEKIKSKVFRYSFDTKCDFYASDITLKEGGFFNFTLHLGEQHIEDCTLGIPGWVNVENAVGASAIAYLHGVSLTGIKEALRTFKGVARRFDIRINTPQCAYIDDYAHHPKEIEAAITSIRNIFKGRKLCGIFQPHLYTRTRDFYKEFAQSLSLLDELILIDIYPARELPIEGITSKIILDLVTIDNKILIPKEEIISTLEKRDTDVVITFGAGDIDRYINPITEYLKERFHV